MKLPMALTVSGLMIAGGAALAATPANAATGQGKVTVSPRGPVSIAAVTAVSESRPPRCRKYVRGYTRHTRGRTVRVRGYWLPRGCVRR
jgi:hypothetical protein